MIRRLFLGACTAFAFAIPTPSAAIALQPGVPLTVNLGAQSVLNEMQFDLADPVNQFRLKATALDNCAGQTCDIDLFLRHGEVFSVDNRSVLSDLIVQSQYYSAGPTGNEFVIVSDYSMQPSQAGAWNIVLVNASNGPTRVQLLLETFQTEQLTTTIEPIFNSDDAYCDTAPWHDPVHGADRQALFIEAANKLAQQIHSAVPIKVQACWKDYGKDENGAITLAAAGPYLFYMDAEVTAHDYVPSPQALAGVRLHAPWLPVKHNWYAGPALARMAGTYACNVAFLPCDWPDIVVFYNSNEAAAKYYDVANNPTARSQTLSVTIHEMTHGLGFLGLINTTHEEDTDPALGESYFGYDDIYDTNASYTQQGNSLQLMDLTDTQRTNALTSVTRLRWLDATANASTMNILRDLAPPNNYVRLYAPDPLEDGSTLSHIDPGSHPGQLMGPFIVASVPQTLGLAEPMLRALGWDPASRTAATYAPPLPDNWYDRAHSGHGIDFQRIFVDPIAGDIYFVVFYTYGNSGSSEFYTALGRVIDGRFVAARDVNGNSLTRVKYDATKPAGQRLIPDANVPGDVAIDFAQAEKSNACRAANRAGAITLGVMSWSISGIGADWCIEPVIPPNAHPTPDFTGHWAGGAADSGWGLEVLNIADGSGTPTIVVYLYYPDAQGNPRWATASTGDYQTGAAIDLNEVSNGFCRTCPPPSQLQVRKIGTIRLTLNQPTREEPPSGLNRVDIQIPGIFTRNNVPMTLLSLPPVN